MGSILLLIIGSFSASLCLINPGFGQAFENWQTYMDPAKRFTLFYPSDLLPTGRENFLSSTDLTLGNPNFTREFKIAITYNDDDTSLANYAEGLGISPEKYLLGVEQQLKPSYSIYNFKGESLQSNDLYGFPTVSNTIDYTNHFGESGRTMNALAVVNGKGSFLFSYSNGLEDFEEYLPVVRQIMKSIIILK
jgi:hypothetical protein